MINTEIISLKCAVCTISRSWEMMLRIFQSRKESHVCLWFCPDSTRQDNEVMEIKKKSSESSYQRCRWGTPCRTAIKGRAPSNSWSLWSDCASVPSVWWGEPRRSREEGSHRCSTALCGEALFYRYHTRQGPQTRMRVAVPVRWGCGGGSCDQRGRRRKRSEGGGCKGRVGESLR